MKQSETAHCRTGKHDDCIGSVESETIDIRHDASAIARDGAGIGKDRAKKGTPMRSWWRGLLFFLQFATVGLALAFVLTRLWPEHFGAASAPQPPAAAPAPAVESYRSAVERAAPSVVNIYTRRRVLEQAYSLFDDPRTRQRVAVPIGVRQRLAAAAGAGVIVRGEGYVLTNFHVVSSSDVIYVGLYDGRVVEARVVGTDQETDLAVLKIEGTNFPAAQIAPPERAAAVGDVVLAIGNPYGQGQAVTLGIVSATGRDQPALSLYEDMIQTDAEINRGNSGGALVNPRGELVGISASSVAPGTGTGISYAIPAAGAKRVLEQILRYGHVKRGWMGLEFADAAASASPVRGPDSAGVLVTAVAEGGPAALAGLQPGDVITGFDDVRIENEFDLRYREARADPGTIVSIEGARSGIPFRSQLTLAERPQPQSNGAG
jgi:serine protease DegS/serine protease DegQ